MKIRVCVAGATGWAASELCKSMVLEEDLELVSAVSRKHAGQDLNQVLNLSARNSIPVFGTLEEALRVPCDVLVEYTTPDMARRHVMAALDAGVNVVVGTSGLSDSDYEDIRKTAEKKGKAVLAVGNFAISAVLLNRFSEIAAKYMPHWEIIDYAKDTKVDSPSGSALELASRLSKVGKPVQPVPLDKMKGIRESRGASLNGIQVHSVRLPGFVISLEAIFGMPDEKLTLRHDAGSSARPYVGGALLAIRKVGSFTGLRRGLDSVMNI